MPAAATMARGPCLAGVFRLEPVGMRRRLNLEGRSV